VRRSAFQPLLEKLPRFAELSSSHFDLTDEVEGVGLVGKLREHAPSDLFGMIALSLIQQLERVFQLLRFSQRGHGCRF
jgi:hypothetical protein